MGIGCLRTQDSKPKPGEEDKSSVKVGLSDFHIEKVLGKGAFGKVFLVTKKDSNEVFAMKSMRKELVESNQQKGNIKRERQIMGHVANNFIVQLQYAFQTEERLYFVMDFINGGELFFHLKATRTFSESTAQFYAAEILLALEYLHSEKIIYRDLKPENVLIDSDGHIKITDFGMSKHFFYEKKKRTYSMCGTPEYIAPEILKASGHTAAVDFWSLGALLYEMLAGKPPFYSTNRDEMFKNILKKPVELKPFFSEEACEIIKALLVVDPRHRISNFDELKGLRFFQGIDWRKLSTREVDPPFRPTVSGPRDLRYFDKEFTDETTEMSVANQHPNRALRYEGFSYTNPTNL